MNRRFGSVLLLGWLVSITPATADEPGPSPFAGEKSAWHDGFDRYDYLLDDATLAITPFRRDPAERFGVGEPPAGHHRGVVIVPRRPHPARPWSWRGCYWDHEPQAEVELLRRGFHIAYLSANANLKPGREWDAWHDFLTRTHGLNRSPCFVGMSRGGSYAYAWATAHPDRVAAIYADNPAITPESLAGLGGLAREDVPILHVCGGIDPLLGQASGVIEPIYRALGGRISVLLKEGAGHHPHSLRDPKIVADFLERGATGSLPAPPDLLGGEYRRTVLVKRAAFRRFEPAEGRDLIGRGPEFAEWFPCYAFNLPGVEGPVTVAMPNHSAPRQPWVFRAEPIDRDSDRDAEILARGYRIVVGPVPYNADGPKLAAWDAVYQHLVDHGFDRKPVLAGSGTAAADALTWALAHPDRVSAVVAENPILRASMTPARPLDDLGPLARVGVPLLAVQGGISPERDEQARAVGELYANQRGPTTQSIGSPEAHGPIVDWIVRHDSREGR